MSGAKQKPSSNASGAQGSWDEIQKMVQAGIIPSAERIKEYMRLSPDDEIDKVLLCIADILRLEEDRSEPTAEDMKDLLASLESGKG